MVDGSPMLVYLPIVVVVVVVGLAGWVLQDARSHEEGHRPVIATVLGLTIDRSNVWATLCLICFAAAFPLYILARRASG